MYITRLPYPVHNAGDWNNKKFNAQEKACDVKSIIASHALNAY